MGEMTLNNLTSISLRCQMMTNRKSGKRKEMRNIAGERQMQVPQEIGYRPSVCR